MLRLALLSACVAALAGCAASGSVPNRTASSGFSAGSLIKTDIEREFGKIIGSLDVLSRIIADKADRTVVKVVQSLATAVFLPVK